MLQRENKSVPRNTTYARVYSIALELFGYDKDKLNAWWLSKHEFLDGKAPYELIKEGKARKLIKIIRRCI